LDFDELSSSERLLRALVSTYSKDVALSSTGNSLVSGNVEVLKSESRREGRRKVSQRSKRNASINGEGESEREKRTSSCPTSAMKQTTVYPSSINQARMQEVSVQSPGEKE